MKCEEIAELLPDYLHGSLNHMQVRQVEEHIAHCADCRDEVAVWEKLSLLPVEQPTPASRIRFEAMLDAYRTGRADQNVAASPVRPRGAFWDAFRWLRSPVGAVAWSLVLLGAGAFIGNHVTSSDNSRSQEIAAMHSELTNMRQLVALSLLNQQSASERLQGVTWTRREEHLDPQVVSALMHTLRYDPSVDVRLAALDALGRHANQPQVHKSVVDALQEQQSPLVQVALIDTLLEWRDPEAAQRLEKLRQSPNLNPTVRQRADWAISKLN
jgi:anti-sigma factor RsiW